MLIEERLNKIIEIIKINESATILELSEELNVSKDTIRRDLIQLENANKIKRTHGGAVLNGELPSIVSYNERKLRKQECKIAIGKKTASIIENETSIIFDSATTVESIIPFLKELSLIAITNTLSTALQLSTLPKCKTTILPGRLDNTHLYITGVDTVNKLADYKTDYVLLGAFAIDETGVWVGDEAEGPVKQQMVNSARKRILMVDHTKFNTMGLMRAFKLNEIDYLVTDKLPEGKLKKNLNNAGVEIIVAKKHKEN